MTDASVLEGFKFTEKKQKQIADQINANQGPKKL